MHLGHGFPSRWSSGSSALSGLRASGSPSSDTPQAVSPPRIAASSSVKAGAPPRSDGDEAGAVFFQPCEFGCGVAGFTRISNRSNRRASIASNRRRVGRNATTHPASSTPTRHAHSSGYSDGPGGWYSCRKSQTASSMLLPWLGQEGLCEALLCLWCDSPSRRRLYQKSRRGHSTGLTALTCDRPVIFGQCRRRHSRSPVPLRIEPLLRKSRHSAYR